MTLITAFRSSSGVPVTPGTREPIFVVSGLVRVHDMVAIVTEDITSSVTHVDVPTIGFDIIPGSYSIDSTHSILTGTRLSKVGLLPPASTTSVPVTDQQWFMADGATIGVVHYNPDGIDTGALEYTVYYEQVTVGASITSV